MTGRFGQYDQCHAWDAIISNVADNAHCTTWGWPATILHDHERSSDRKRDESVTECSQLPVAMTDIQFPYFPIFQFLPISQYVSNLYFFLLFMMHLTFCSFQNLYNFSNFQFPNCLIFRIYNFLSSEASNFLIFQFSNVSYISFPNFPS